MLQKAYAEGLRALLVYTGRWQDRMVHGPDADLAARVNDLLLPLVKGSARSGRTRCSATSRCRPSAAPAT